MSILGNRITAVVAGAAVIATLGGTAAFAANTITGDDVKDGTLTQRDFTGNVQTYFGGINHRSYNNQQSVYGLNQDVADLTKQMSANEGVKDDVTDLQERVAALEAAVAELQAVDESGVNRNWVANAGSEILDENTVKLTGPDPTSVEIQNLDLDVDATKTIEFTYSLSDGAVYGAGAPRVFIVVNGEMVNTHDSDPSDAGVDNQDGTFTKSVTIGKNGTVGLAGVVYDSGAPGTVTVTDVVISGHAVKFQ